MPNILFVGNGTLHISRLVQANEGIYQCFAGNIYGRTMSSFAKLRMATTDSSPETNQVTAVIDQPVAIHCRETTKCFPVPYYSWELKHGDRSTPIQMDNRRQVDENGSCYCCLITILLLLLLFLSNLLTSLSYSTVGRVPIPYTYYKNHDAGWAI